jgi:hypothetical protein
MWANARVGINNFNVDNFIERKIYIKKKLWNLIPNQSNVKDKIKTKIKNSLS